MKNPIPILTKIHPPSKRRFDSGPRLSLVFRECNLIVTVLVVLVVVQVAIAGALHWAKAAGFFPDVKVFSGQLALCGYLMIFTALAVVAAIGERRP